MTVTSASTATPSTSPVEPSTPEAMSAATTGAPQPFMASIASVGGRSRRAVEAGAEDRVDDAARALEGSGYVSRLDLAARLRQACVIPGRVVRELIRRPEQERLDLEAGLGQEPCGDKPVAAVVALATDDPDRPRLGHVAHRLGERRARGLHQLERGNATLARSPRSRRHACSRRREADSASREGPSPAA